MKLCKRCNIEKPIEYFCKQTKSKDGIIHGVENVINNIKKKIKKLLSNIRY